MATPPRRDNGWKPEGRSGVCTGALSWSRPRHRVLLFDPVMLPGGIWNTSKHIMSAFIECCCRKTYFFFSPPPQGFGGRQEDELLTSISRKQSVMTSAATRVIWFISSHFRAPLSPRKMLSSCWKTWAGITTASWLLVGQICCWSASGWSVVIGKPAQPISHMVGSGIK